MRNALILLFVLVIGFFALHGDVYTWIKSKGVLDAEERAKQQTQKDLELEMRVNNDGVLAQENYERNIKKQREKYRHRRQARSNVAPQKPEIKQYTFSRAELFVKPGCYSCDKARSFLEKRGVRVIEYDISHDTSAKERHKLLDSNGRLPLALINGRVVVRFNRQEYIDALEHN